MPGAPALLRSVLRFVVARRLAMTAAVSLLLVICSLIASAAISLSTSTAYTQNFDGIGTAAAATLPTDFRADRISTVRTVGSFATAGTVTTSAGGANLSTSAANGIYNFGSG